MNSSKAMDIDDSFALKRKCAGGPVLPLCMVHTGEKVKVRSISGVDETRRFLSNLGFVENAEVAVVSELNGNVIVNIKGTRIAISKAMAKRVLTS